MDVTPPGGMEPEPGPAPLDKWDAWLAVLGDQRWQRVDGFLTPDIAGEKMGGEVPFPVWARLALDEGGAVRVTGLLIGEREDGEPLQAREVRKVSPARIERAIREYASTQLPDDLRREWLRITRDEPERSAYPRLKPGPKAEPVDYQEWADRWRQAHAKAEGREVAWLADNYPPAKSTIHVYIREARERGLIPPSQHKNAVEARKRESRRQRRKR